MISTPTTTRTAKSPPLSSSNIRYGVVANISRSHNLREKVPRSPGFDSLYRSFYFLQPFLLDDLLLLMASDA
ncbi:hypothetical protein CEP53_004112 [Fusarium sp. AF-6]|nr:hypothetical protein CEP53_004112 [Fusarium sp. AF-6]